MANLFSAGIGSVANFLTTQYNNKQAAQREKNARHENYTYGELAAKTADQRTRSLYNDLYSPEAQMQQLKEAGLSPSIYASGGMAGKSGVSGAQGTGTSGISPQVFAADPISAAMQVAQIGNIKADTKLKESQADNTDKDTELKGQEIINLVADTANKKAENRLITANADLAECNSVESEMTLQTRIEKAYHNTAMAAAEVRSAVTKADLDEATFDAAYQLAYANLNNTLTNTEYLKSKIRVNKEQIKEIAERIRNSQWETWAMEKEQNRKDAVFVFDKAKFKTEVKQWAAEQNIKLAIAEIEMVSDLVGYVCNFATAAMSNVTKLKTTQAYTDAKKRQTK